MNSLREKLRAASDRGPREKAEREKAERTMLAGDRHPMPDAITRQDGFAEGRSISTQAALRVRLLFLSIGPSGASSVPKETLRNSTGGS